MKNDVDKLILGFMIGGLLGGAAFYLLRANKKEKEMFFKRIGKIITEIGEFLKESGLENQNAACQEILKTVPKKGHLAEAAILAAIGINLWKKWR